MTTLSRTDSSHPDFIALVQRLDAELAVIDGDDHAFYDQFNKIYRIKYAVVAYENGAPAACGAIKDFAPNIMEIKRMYTLPEYRGKGLATRVLLELEKWAAELQGKKCLLETGKAQIDAVGLYQKQGYKIIPNYGQYAGVENSVCFEKEITV